MPSETPEQVAERELAEELGYSVFDWDPSAPDAPHTEFSDGAPGLGIEADERHLELFAALVRERVRRRELERIVAALENAMNSHDIQEALAALPAPPEVSR